MSEKKRYLVGYPHSGIVPQNVEEKLTKFVTRKKSMNKIRRLQSGQHVVEMTEKEAEELAAENPDLLIEEDRELELFMPMPGLPPRVPSGALSSVKVNVSDGKTKKPLSDVTIYCVGKEITYKGKTNAKGVAEVQVFENELKRIIASPLDSYWSKVVSGMILKEVNQVDIELTELVVNGNYDWGHLLLGFDQVRARLTGRGVKIAVIDSGIAPHEDIIATGGYNTLDGQDPNAWNVDEQGHGTHCCGIVAGQPNDIGIIGPAPNAEIYSLKVFPGGRFSDLIEAINWCVDNHMDIISMSLGSQYPSAQIERALLDAYERGITCIAAAGNNGGPVSYPAAYDHVIAVSAIGSVDAFPSDSAHALKTSDYFGYDQRLFFAGFSNYGPQVNICAPGVAILSTVPSGYAAWDGTSMACPLVSGLAALILEGYPEIRTGDAWQPYQVLEIMRSTAIDLGLPAEMQGAGLPQAETVLAEACYRWEQNEIAQAYYRHHLGGILERAQTCSQFIKKSLEELETLEK